MSVRRIILHAQILPEEVELRADHCAKELVLVNPKGVHARAAAKIVDLVDAYQNRWGTMAFMGRDDVYTKCESVMGLLMLAAGGGVTVEVICDGPNCDELLNAIEHLITEGFGEDLNTI